MRLARRRLHARSVKGCATILAPSALALSPVQGALCWGSPALSAVWEVGGDAASPPVARLARALFHRHDPQEPLRLTANKSLPGCHLQGRPAWQGHLLGLACRGASTIEVRDQCSRLGVADVARETKVSLRRFASLVRLLGDALQPATCSLQPPSATSAANAGLPPGLCGSAVWLAYLWASATRKECLLEFLVALQEHVPVLDDTRSRPHSPSWRRAWAEEAFATDALPTPGAVADMAESAESAESAEAAEAAEAADEAGGAARLERLACALVSRGDERPEAEQERHGYRGQPAVADCVEACLRDVLGLALWRPLAARFDPAVLPRGADLAAAAFFAGADSTCSRAGALWFDLCSAREGLGYLKGGGEYEYELAPTVDNFAAALGSLLGQRPPPPQPGMVAPLWPGCPVGWELRGAGGKKPTVVARRLGPSLTRGGDRGSSAAGPGGAQRGARGGAQGGDELCFVFNEGVHCYALRSVTAREPPWLAGARRTALQRWRELSEPQRVASPPPLCCWAASRLLGGTLLDVRAHAPLPAGRLAAQSAALAVLAAEPVGYNARLKATPLVLRAGPEAWWTLPLLLRPANFGWDDLSLGACSELLALESARFPAAATAIAAAAAAEPMLAVMLAIRTHDDGAMRAAASRCVAWSQRSQILRIALLQDGFSLSQRARALRIFVEVYSVQLLRLAPRGRGAVEL